MRFITRGSGYTQFVTAQEVVWRLDGAQQDHAVRMSFAGATSAAVHGEDALAGRTNYLKGADPANWVAGAQQFAAARLTDLYPGISLKLYGTRQRPEYDSFSNRARIPTSFDCASRAQSGSKSARAAS